MRLLATVIALTVLMIATPTDSANYQVVMNETVTVTAYTKYESCSKKKNPDCLTASGIPVGVGHAAMSRDLERQGLRFGDRIHLIGIGDFVIQDRTHERWRKRIDIYMESYREALQFGKKKARMFATREKGWISA